MNTDSIIIRDMTGDDILEVIQLKKDMLRGKEGLKIADPYINPEPSCYFGGELGMSKVAELNGQIVGFILGKQKVHPYYLTNDAYISLLIVAEKYQASGIAKRLAKAFMDNCMEQNIENINSIMNSDDTPTISLYKSLGFHQNNYTEMRIIGENMELL